MSLVFYAYCIVITTKLCLQMNTQVIPCNIFRVNYFMEIF